MIKKDLKVAVLGAGAMGCLFGGLLAEKGLNVTLIDVWKKQVKVLYSTRHTFINRCYNKGVDRDILKSIVGHEPDFTMDVYGGNPFTPKQLYNEISKVSYSKIRWNRLEVDWKLILE